MFGNAFNVKKHQLKTKPGEYIKTEHRFPLLSQYPVSATGTSIEDARASLEATNFEEDEKVKSLDVKS